MSVEFPVIIEREPGAPTVGAYSPDVEVYVVRDATVGDDDLIAAYGEALRDFIQGLRDEGLPLPTPYHRVVVVEAA